MRLIHHHAAPTRALPAGLLCLALLTPSLVGAGIGPIVLPVPPGSRVHSLGDGLVLNGAPLAVRLFSVASTVRETSAWYDRELGAPLSHSASGRADVLVYRMRSQWLTLQLQPTLQGTRGLIALSDPESVHKVGIGQAPTSARWLAHMPVGSRLLLDLRSRDRDRYAHQMAIANHQPPDRNRDAVMAAMADQGLLLDREVTVAASARGAPGGHVLHFQGDTARAVATIQHFPGGQGFVVLTTLMPGEPAP